jgi:hypothetical protein
MQAKHSTTASSRKWQACSAGPVRKTRAERLIQETDPETPASATDAH